MKAISVSKMMKCILLLTCCYLLLNNGKLKIEMFFKRLDKWRCSHWRQKVYIQKANEFYYNFCHFSALAASFQGKNTNSNDDNHVSPEKFESLRHRINQEASEKIKPKPEHIGMGNLSCYSCSPPDCRNPTICYNAVRCQVSLFDFTSF